MIPLNEFWYLAARCAQQIFCKRSEGCLETEERKLYSGKQNKKRRNQREISWYCSLAVIVHSCTWAIENIDLKHGIFRSSKSKLFSHASKCRNSNSRSDAKIHADTHTHTNGLLLLLLCGSTCTNSPDVLRCSTHAAKSSNCFCLCANGFLLYMSKQTNIYYCWSCWACLCLLFHATDGSGITNVYVCASERERESGEGEWKLGGTWCFLMIKKCLFTFAVYTLAVCSFLHKSFARSLARSFAPHF